MTTPTAKSCNGKGTVTKVALGSMASAILTGAAAWLTLGGGATMADVKAEVKTHAEFPHADSVSRHEFDFIREGLTDIKAHLIRLENKIDNPDQ